ncbi:fimbrial protein [Lysobacter sp. GCM10012299]|uniref:fimbrial protein n=1 Tax=Lysobacter sp. GCM10012299 TaxID=3317333 RepID=UPI00360D4AC9
MEVVEKLAIGALSLAMLGSGSAFAASNGTLNFEGAVTAVTCNVGVNGSGASDATVTLPTVPATTLDAAGKVAGRTFMRFGLLDTTCSDGTGGAIPDSVSIFFTANSDIDVATAGIGRLRNTAVGGAQNVALQILGADLMPINLYGDAVAQAAGANTVAAQQGAVLNRYIEYYATGVSTAGSVRSIARYELNYF